MPRREWFVLAEPVPGYFPKGATIDPGTNTANKLMIGPFYNAVHAAEYVEQKRPANLWRGVIITSRRKK